MTLNRNNLRLLLVDDDEDETELLRADLAKAGFIHPVTHFRNGAIALEYFKYKKATGTMVPHLILLDLNLPLIDGVRALHRLREVSPFRDLPVIILTGTDNADKRREVAELGVFRFLTKQLKHDNVISALDAFIDFQNNQEDAPEARQTVPFIIPDKTGAGPGRQTRINLF